MFYRNILEKLRKWSLKENRKPLILRGARQVGKTSIVHLFAKGFPQYIYLNLEHEADRSLFQEFRDTEELLTAIFFNKKMRRSGKTLVFIDEIQAEPQAVSQLRFIYEKRPELFVIAAGSMLETAIDVNVSFPVGRTEYMAVRPVSFPEFLGAMGEDPALDYLKNSIPLNHIAHETLLKHFHQYTLIGGMPEIVSHFATHRDLTALEAIYESLLVSYMDDVEKYANNETQRRVMHHLIRTSFTDAGKRITFEGFGRSGYKSREVGESFRMLEKAFLLQLTYPTTDVKIPFLPDLKKSPRLQMLDTGLVNYMAGLQEQLLGTKDLNEQYQGIITKHIVGQELLANEISVLSRLCFWVRQKKSSQAEVDFVYQFKEFLIPIEVKSGATGKLRSLFLFMDQAPHPFAVRIYAGKVELQKVKTLNGKSFHLLNLPYFALSMLDEYLEWMISQSRKPTGKK